jgi:hypothetical protein
LTGGGKESGKGLASKAKEGRAARHLGPSAGVIYAQAPSFFVGLAIFRAGFGTSICD